MLVFPPGHGRFLERECSWTPCRRAAAATGTPLYFLVHANTKRRLDQQSASRHRLQRDYVDSNSQGAFSSDCWIWQWGERLPLERTALLHCLMHFACHPQVLNPLPTINKGFPWFSSCGDRSRLHCLSTVLRPVQPRASIFRYVVVPMLLCQLCSRTTPHARFAVEYNLLILVRLTEAKAVLELVLGEKYGVWLRLYWEIDCTRYVAFLVLCRFADVYARESVGCKSALHHAVRRTD